MASTSLLLPPAPLSAPGAMLLAIRIWLGNIFLGAIRSSNRPAGARVSRRRLIKWPCKQTELEALLYVAANTTIPVPQVYRAYQYRGELAIEMEYLRGCKTIQDSWHELSNEEKESSAEQVAGYIEQLRALQPPKKESVSSTNGGQCRDIRVGTVRLFGPFKDVPTFHTFIRGGLPLKTAHGTFGEKVVKIHKRQYGIRFTHGDLASLNILVRDGKIAAIIDWECAGRYPEYWEYTKAHYNSVYLPEFHRILDQKMTRYDEELEAERDFWEIYDQFLDTDPPEVADHTTIHSTLAGQLTSTAGVTLEGEN